MAFTKKKEAKLDLCKSAGPPAAPPKSGDKAGDEACDEKREERDDKPTAGPAASIVWRRNQSTRGACVSSGLSR